MAWGATGSLGVGCYRVLWLGVLPSPLVWGGTGSFGLGRYQVPLRGVVPAHLAWGDTRSLGVGWYPLTWPCSLEGWCWRSAFSPNVEVRGQSPLLTVLAVWHGWVRVASDPVRVSQTERSQYSVTVEKRFHYHVTCLFAIRLQKIATFFLTSAQHPINSFVSNLLTKSLFTGEDDGMF